MKKILIILIVLIVIIEVNFIYLTNQLTAISGEAILDAGFHNNEETYTIISNYGDEGIVIYKRIQLLDFIFPACYGLMLMILLIQLGGRPFWLPLIAAGFDYTENILIRSMLNAYPNNLNLGVITSVCVGMKFLLITASVGLIIFYRIQRRKS